MAGPYERQLRTAVAAMRDKDVVSSDNAWTESAENLALVAHRLRKAARAMREGFGEDSEIARHGHAAFTKAAKRASRRSRQMRRAAAAIAQAKEAMASAQQALDDMEREPRRPGAFTPNPSQSSKQQLKAEARHGQRMRDYNTKMAEREERSRAALQDLDMTYADSSETMKQIHGEPDPPPPVRADRPGKPAPVAAAPKVAPPAGVFPAPAAVVDVGLPAGPAEVAGTDPLGVRPHAAIAAGGLGGGSGISGAAVMGGLAGAGIGMLGGAGAAARAVGAQGVATSGTTSNTRPIGAGGRPVGAGAVLGRGAGGGASGRGTARGRTRTGRGTTGAAGSRSGVAGGATPGRRGSRDERERTTVADYVDSEKEWLDDEGSPPVLD